MMRHWLWRDTLNNAGQYGTDTLYMHAFLSVIIIFMVCILIDKMRMRFVEEPFFK